MGGHFFADLFAHKGHCAVRYNMVSYRYIASLCGSMYRNLTHVLLRAIIKRKELHCEDLGIDQDAEKVRLLHRRARKGT